MSDTTSFRPARRDDLYAIVALLADDPLGAVRERFEDPLPEAYVRAFEAIDSDPGQDLIVAERGGVVVGVLQLTIIASLTWQGSSRALIEGVRVAAGHRGMRIGEALVQEAIVRARRRGCAIVQLTTDRSRTDAHRFYERLGFKATHVGMKLHLTCLAALLLAAGCQRDESAARALPPVADSASTSHDTARMYRLVSPAPGQVLREGSRYVIRWTATGPGAVNVGVAVGGKDRGHLAMRIPAGTDSLEWEVPRGFVSGFGPSRSDAVRIRIQDASDPAIGVTSQPFTIVADSAETSALPAVRVPKGAVIAFWHVPASNAELDADPGLAAALDDHLYYWAGTRELLESAGFLALDQPGLEFAVEGSGFRWTFRAADNALVGHLLVRPNGESRVLYGRHFPDEVMAAADSFLAARGKTGSAGRTR